MSYHQFINHAVYTFAHLRIADRLVHAPSDRGFTVEEIIGDDRKQWSSQLLHRVLRSCMYAGIVQAVNDDKHFLLTPSGMMMTSNHPAHIRDHMLFMFGPIMNGAYQQLPDMVRGEATSSGGARFSGGLDFYTLLNQPDQKESVSIFNGAMLPYSTETGIKLVVGIEFGRFKTIADIGGNRGALLAEVLEYYPSIEHGIVFDLLNVVDQCKDGEEFTSRKILKDRWSFLAGDVFDPSTIPLADAYVIKYVLHNFNDEKYVKILASIRQANENRRSSVVSLFIIEHKALSEGGLDNWQISGIDIVMASIFGDAGERTEDEHKALVQKGGFEFRKMHPIAGPYLVIEAILV